MTKTLSTAFVLAVLAIACGHPSYEYGTTTTTGATARVNPGDGAIDAIASARCQRETVCDSIGPHKPFETHEACLTWIRAEESQRLSDAACPRGIDTSRLDKCLSAIRGERCGDQADSESRVAACDMKPLCMR
jgi:hypothetical protein